MWDRSSKSTKLCALHTEYWAAPDITCLATNSHSTISTRPSMNIISLNPAKLHPRSTRQTEITKAYICVRYLLLLNGSSREEFRSNLGENHQSLPNFRAGKLHTLRWVRGVCAWLPDSMKLACGYTLSAQAQLPTPGSSPVNEFKPRAH